MRKAELENGITVMDPNTMEPVGTSKAAAAQAVNQTIVTRCAYLVPIFFTSPILKFLFTSCGLMPRRRSLQVVLELCFITLGMAMASPLCPAVYPQYPNVATSALEDDLKLNVADSHEFLVYNKGI